MKFTKQLILIIIAAFFTLNVSAQQFYDLFKGNKLYEQLAYSQAIPYFESALTKEFNVDIQEKLANCYRLTNNPLKAEGAFLKTVSKQQ